jgi:hypothetical protein
MRTFSVNCSVSPEKAWPLLATAYGPVIAATLRRLAEVAQSSSGH